MDPKKELELLNNSLLFMQRVDLKGQEAMVFSACVEYLGAKAKALSEQINQNNQPTS